MSIAGAIFRPSNVAPAGTSAAFTYSGSDRTLKITLSGAATNNSFWCNAPLLNGNKYYFEVTCNTINVGTTTYVGVASSTRTLQNNGAYLGQDAFSVGFDNDGRVLYNNSNLGSIQTFTTGVVVCVAVDLVNNKIWFRNDGGNWNNAAIGSQNPATNTGGTSIASLATAGSLRPAGNIAYNNDQLTFNLGDTAFAQTAPAGFSGPAPFTIPTVDVNGAVAYRSASFSTYGAGKVATVATPTKVSSTQAYRGTVIHDAFYGFNRLWGPAGTATGVSGFVQENGVGVSGKKVMLFDLNTGLLLGTALSTGGGTYPTIAALGRTQVFAVAFDPTTYQMLGFDRVTPG